MYRRALHAITITITINSNIILISILSNTIILILILILILVVLGIPTVGNGCGFDYYCCIVLFTYTERPLDNTGIKPHVREDLL